MSPTLIPSLLAVSCGALAMTFALAWWRQVRRTREAEALLARRDQDPVAITESEGDRELGLLAREIGHEFNNVLAIISTTTEVLLMELTLPDMEPDDGRLESSLRQVKSASNRGAELSKRLLEAGRRAAPKDAGWTPPAAEGPASSRPEA